MQLSNILLVLFVVSLAQARLPKQKRSFTIDYENNRFLKDNEPFRFVAGSFHYFRALPETWQRTLRTMRAAGLNAVTTYVEWSLHNPHDGIYKWDGIADIERFIQLAAEEDLYVILRPGPYICAEHDNGGHPYWLYTKHPDIQMRTTDPNYLNEVRIWYDIMMPRMQKYLYGRGGPIILVQIENEYGTHGCDLKFKELMRDETLKFVGDDAALFTNDVVPDVKCGKIPNVLATLDFGKGNRSYVTENWRTLREVQPNGPLVVAEFYPGWFTHWQEPYSIIKTESFIDTFRYMLEDGASVNFYMIFGGTNFGFTAGANDDENGFVADITSYDYDAPITEAGDPTLKLKLIRDVIKDYLPMPRIPLPKINPKMAPKSIQLTPKLTMLSSTARNVLARTPVHSEKPLTFEDIDQYSGFVLYETDLPDLRIDPSVLNIKKLHDRALVFVDNNFIGVLSRQNKVFSLPISLGYGKKLQILVENLGRINIHKPEDVKGIIGDVILNHNVTLKDWIMTGFPLNSINRLTDLLEKSEFELESLRDIETNSHLRNGPVIYHATFDIEQTPILDTYIDTRNWGKGVLFINGFNLGRYWPLAGPQFTLYLPKDLLREKDNSIVLFELQKAPRNNRLSFCKKPIFTPKAEM